MDAVHDNILNLYGSNTYIARSYFPKLKKEILYSKILYTTEAISYMTKRTIAEIISSIIHYHLRIIKDDMNNITITDATAGIGGNTFSFAQWFKQVNAVECKSETYKLLKNNIDIYNYTNVDCICADYTKIFNQLTQDVIFIDPPWGGKTYKQILKNKLMLSGYHLGIFCKMLIETMTSLIVLKLPLNFDFDYFYEELNTNMLITTIKMHKLDKMYICVIYPNSKVS